jgi:hypothetical protein
MGDNSAAGGTAGISGVGLGAGKSVQMILRLPDNLVPWLKQLIRQKEEAKSEESLVDLTPEGS